MNKPITQHDLKLILGCDYNTGNCWYKIKQLGCNPIGMRANYRIKGNTQRIKLPDNKIYNLERVVFLHAYGHWMDNIRFKDNNSLNCALDNLIEIPEQEHKDITLINDKYWLCKVYGIKCGVFKTFNDALTFRLNFFGVSPYNAIGYTKEKMGNTNFFRLSIDGIEKAIDKEFEYRINI